MRTTGLVLLTRFHLRSRSDWRSSHGRSRITSGDLLSIGELRMPNPRTVAIELIGDFFGWQNESTPDQRARDLINRIKIKRGSRWFPEAAVRDGCEILQRAAFDIEVLARDFLGIELKSEDLGRYDSLTGAPVFGLAEPDEWLIQICPRARQYMPLFRATVAHEIGHLQLHSQAAAFSPQSHRRPAVEYEADAFMNALLAPQAVLVLGVALASHFYSLPFKRVLFNANSESARCAWKRAILPVLVNHLCVSRHLLCVTFVEMGILSRETCQFHLDYAMPNRWLAPGGQRSKRFSINDELDRLCGLHT